MDIDKKMGSLSEVVSTVPLHWFPDLIETCADLVNEEWKRSQASRIHSLQKSSDNFPVCLVLLRTQRSSLTIKEDEPQLNHQVIGHARLSLVFGRPKSLFVETVVVSKELRGKGYGRKLMEDTEKYAKSRGFTQLHLTTHDKQYFYAHLGYVLSEPVHNAGSATSIMSMEILEKLSGPQTAIRSSSRTSTSSVTLSSSLNTLSCSSVSSQCDAFPPQLAVPSPLPSQCRTSATLPVTLPLPPPPPPPAGTAPLSFQGSVKFSTLPAPLLLHPQSLSPLLQASPASASNILSSVPLFETNIMQTLLETPYKDFRGLPVFHMRKDI